MRTKLHVLLLAAGVCATLVAAVPAGKQLPLMPQSPAVRSHAGAALTPKTNHTLPEIPLPPGVPRPVLSGRAEKAPVKNPEKTPLDGTPGVTWIRATEHAQWSERYYHSTEVKDGLMWVMGGNYRTDVWSSPDGVAWSQATGNAPWGYRLGQSSAVFQNELWIMGGTYASCLNDVWHSSNGADWYCAPPAPGARWSGRYFAAATAFDGKLWILGGLSSDGSENDVWYSSDGASWTCATEAAPWSARYGHSVVVFDNKLWLMGGYSPIYGHMNDVWFTTNGTDWTQAAEYASWDPREWTQAVAFDGSMWVLGGEADYCRNDVWRSSNGVDWTQVTGSAEWSARLGHSSAVLNDRLWILGGYNCGNYSNDVWYTFSAERDVGVSYIAAPSGDVEPGATATPSAWVINYGDHTETFDVVMEIGSDYTDTKQVTLDAGQSCPVDFALWTATQPRVNLTRCRTMLVGDQIPSNDEKTGQVRVVVGMPWTQVLSSTPFGQRYQAAAVDFNGALWVMGGYDWSNYRHDVWRSDYGADWTKVTEVVQWSQRYGHSVVVKDNLLWLLGGYDPQAGYRSDVWNSPDGESWNEVSSTSPWGWRFGQACVVHDGKIWIIGGYTALGPSNDVWCSSDGKNWDHVTEAAPWAGRYMHSSLVLGGKIWVFGGYDGTRWLNDVWSSTDGVTWTCATEHAEWEPRYGASSCVYDDQLFVMGGSAPYGSNEVWKSSDGADWTFVGYATWDYSYEAPVVVHGDRIWLFDLWNQGSVWCSGTLPLIQVSPASVSALLMPDQSKQCFGYIYNAGTEALSWSVEESPPVDWLSEDPVSGELAPQSSVGLTVSLSSQGMEPGTYTSTLHVASNDPLRPVVDVPMTLRVAQLMEWGEATPSAGWSPRWGHSSVVFDNKLWVLGGSDNYWTGNMFSDIWSSPDGVNWTQVSEQAPWGPRRRFPTIVYDNKLWILGGSQNWDDGHNDVWSSEDGVNWSQVTAAAPWSGRFLHSAVVFDNKMWVLGGYWNLNDVWYSSNGIDWTQAPTPPWSPRYAQTALVFDGKLWVLGGSNGSIAFDDVWYTEDGENWTCATSNAGWEGRAGHGSVVYDNKMWVLGGGYPVGPARNDVSWSSDGVTWTTAIASWGIRVEPAAQVLGDRIFIMGGDGAQNPGSWCVTPLNDVWFAPPGQPDMGVASIESPTGVVAPGSIKPKATVHNYGSVQAGFDVTFKINCIPPYVKTFNVPDGIPPGQDLTVEFPEWTATDGYYTAQCSTVTTGDKDPSNDAKTVDFVVAPYGWSSRAALPKLPSREEEGDGGWLAYNPGNKLVYAAKGEKTADFYVFDPKGSAWTSLTAIPKGREKELPEGGCRGVADGADCVYMTKGASTLGFWKYTISTDAWTQLADVPEGKHKVKGGADLAYAVKDGVGCIYLLKGNGCEFYKYNTATGKWATLPDAPDGHHKEWPDGSWLAFDGDHTIYAHKAKHLELWAFDLASETWGSEELPGMPIESRFSKGKEKAGEGSAGAWLDGAIYALKGNNTCEFWKYVPADKAWYELDTMPRRGAGRDKNKVGPGGDIAATDNMLFAFKGSKTNELWRYAPPPEGFFAGADAGAGTTPLPREFALDAFPNPVVHGTAIRYAVPSATNVSLRLYDVSGALAKTVACGHVLPGRYAVSLSAQHLARGIYILKLESKACHLTRKLVIE